MLRRTPSARAARADRSPTEARRRRRTVALALLLALAASTLAVLTPGLPAQAEVAGLSTNVSKNKGTTVIGEFLTLTLDVNKNGTPDVDFQYSVFTSYAGFQQTNLVASGIATTGVASVQLNGALAGTLYITVNFTGTTHDGITYNENARLTHMVTNPTLDQSISFTAPSTGQVGGEGTLSATGGGSGNPVVVSVQGASDPGVCELASQTRVRFLAVGTCRLAANQAGGPGYNAAPEVVRTITVTKAAQTLSLSTPVSATLLDSPSVLADVVPSSLPVTVTILTPAVCTFAGGATSATGGGALTLLTTGTCRVSAAQAGNAQYAAVGPLEGSFPVTKVPQAIAFDLPDTATYGDQLTLAATGGASGNPVTYAVASASTSVCSISGTTLQLLKAGTCKVTASQAGTATYDDATPVEQVVGVNKAVLRFAMSPAQREYGIGTAFYPPTLTGLVPGDNLGSLFRTPMVCGDPIPNPAARPAGAYLGALTCFGGQLFPDAEQRYAIEVVPATLTVTKAPLRVRPLDVPMVYGGTRPAVLPEFDGFRNGDTFTVLGTLPTCEVDEATPTTPAGTYADVVTCSGGVAANYELSYDTADLVVAKRPLVIQASDGEMTYGGTPPTITPSFATFVPGDDVDDLDVPPTCTANATSTTAASLYANGTSCSGAQDANYDISYGTGQLLVRRAPLTITAGSTSTTYGTTPVVTASYDGFVNGETASTFGVAPTCSSTVTPTTGVGSYAGANTCSGTLAPNYAVTSVAGNAVVGKAILQVVAEDKGRRFGEANPALTFRYDGFVNGEGASVVQGTPQLSTAATAASPAGTYLIVPDLTGVSSANYALVPVNGRLVVAKAPVFITAPAMKSTSVVANAGVVFSAGVRTGSATGAPAVGLRVTFSAKNLLGYTLTCTGTTDAFGVATCRHHNGTAFLLAGTYTVTVAEGESHLGGSATGKVTL